MMKKEKDCSNVSDIRLALKVYGRTVIVTIMSVIIYVSLLFLFNAFGTHSIGYQLYEKVEGGNPVAIGDPYYYKDGEGPVPDIELEENQTYVILRSELEGGIKLAFDIISQAFMLILLLMLPYGIMKDRGEKDRNLTRFEDQGKDAWRGLRVGLIASAPSFALYVAMVATRFQAEPTARLVSLFRIANYPFTPILDWLMPVQPEITLLGAIGSLLLLMLVPGICALAYWFGYQHINPTERLIYKKK